MLTHFDPGIRLVRQCLPTAATRLFDKWLWLSYYSLARNTGSV